MPRGGFMGGGAIGKDMFFLNCKFFFFNSKEWLPWKPLVGAARKCGERRNKRSNKYYCGKIYLRSSRFGI